MTQLQQRIERAVSRQGYLPQQYARDVSAEARDENGEWTAGGSAAGVPDAPVWFKGKGKSDDQKPKATVGDDSHEALKGSGKTVKGPNGKLTWFPKQSQQPTASQAKKTESPAEPSTVSTPTKSDDGASQFQEARRKIAFSKATMTPEETQQLISDTQETFRKALGLTKTTASDIQSFESRVRAGIANFSKRAELAENAHRYSAGTSWHPGKTMSADELNREAQQASEPKSAEHAEAGNYRKGHVRIHGMDISIETPKGGIRRGVSRDGKSWEREMKSHYGYIKRTISLADGDHIDVFIGPHPEHPIVYVVDQVNPGSGHFDEHKCLIGFKSKEDAKSAYHENYPDDWKGFNGIKAMHSRDFKDWLKSGDTKKPVSGGDGDNHVRRFDLAAAKYSKSSDSGGTWITLKPHGDEGKGVHVQLSASGEIITGPSELLGKHISELSAEHKRASTLIPHAHEFLLQQHEGREKAKQSARRITGLTAGDIARHENAYRDHSTVEGFDTSSRTVAMEHGELGIDPDAHDTPARIWELIREGAISKPTKNSPEVHSLAKEWAKGKKPAKSKEPEYAHDDDWDNWDSRADVAAFKYAKEHGDQGRWITLKPHGDDSEDYVHVKIGDDGRIEAGPAGMAKKGIQHLSDFGKKEKHDTARIASAAAHQTSKIAQESNSDDPSEASAMHKVAAHSHKTAEIAHEAAGNSTEAQKHREIGESHSRLSNLQGKIHDEEKRKNANQTSAMAHTSSVIAEGHSERADKAKPGDANYSELNKKAASSNREAAENHRTALREGGDKQHGTLAYRHDTMADHHERKSKPEKSATPAKKPGIPGMQQSLLDDSEAPGQRQLFDYVPPKKGDTKSKPESTGGSTLEKIGDEQKEREEASKPISGQKDLLAGDEDTKTRTLNGHEWKKNSAGKWAWFKDGKQQSGAFPNESDHESAAHGRVNAAAEKVDPQAKETTITTHPEFQRLNQVYGNLSHDEITEKLAKMDQEIADHQKVGSREFNGMGGRRSGAAMSSQAAREVGQEKLLLNAYKNHKFGDGEPESVPEKSAKSSASPASAPNVKSDDIPYEAGYNAHRNTSFVPERRARQRQEDYVQQMNGDWNFIASKMKEGADDEARAEFERYRQGYVSKYLSALHAASRTASPMITGPARFPTDSNRKRIDTEMKRYDELKEFREKALRSIIKKVAPAGQGGPIKSSDDNAVEALHSKLKKLEHEQDMRKRINAAHRAFVKSPSSLDKSDLPDAAKEMIRTYKPQYSWEPSPYPPYSLSNLSANIRNVKDRIDQVSKMKSGSKSEAEYSGGVRVSEDPDAARIRIHFPGKPERSAIETLKSSGFRWSPTESAWQRHLNGSGRSAVDYVLNKLGHEKSADVSKPEAATNDSESSHEAIPEMAHMSADAGEKEDLENRSRADVASKTTSDNSDPYGLKKILGDQYKEPVQQSTAGKQLEKLENQRVELNKQGANSRGSIVAKQRKRVDLDERIERLRQTVKEENGKTESTTSKEDELRNRADKAAMKYSLAFHGNRS